MKLSYANAASAAVAEPLPKATAVSDETMQKLSDQTRANLIRNVAESKSRPDNDPADWEI